MAQIDTDTGLSDSQLGRFDTPGSAPVFRAIADDGSSGLGLRTRLFLGSVLLLLFTIGASLAYLSQKSQTVAEQKIREDLNAVPAIFDGYTSTQATSREHAVRSLAEEPGTKALMAEVREHPETFHDSAQGFAKVLGARSVFLFDPAGLLLSRSDRPVGEEVGRDFSGITWVDTPRIQESEASAYILEVTQGHTLSVIASAPVTQGRDTEQRLNGVIAAAFDVSNERARELSLLTAGEIAFVANVAADDTKLQLETLSSTPKFKGAMPDGMRAAVSHVFEKDATSEAIEFAVNGEAFIATALPVRSGSGRVLAALVVGRSKDAEMAPFLEIRRSLIIVGVMALLLSAPLSFAMAQGLAGPLQKLAEGARKIARGELDVVLPTVGGGEVGALSRAFESMVGELKEKAQLEALVANMQRRPGDITYRGGTGSFARGTGLSGKISQIFAGRYEILSELGKGGMGVVFRARDRELDEEVALKVLTSTGDEQPAHVDRLRQEIKLARVITHPNVVRAFDYGESEGARFLTMEYVPGTTLREVIDVRNGLEITPALQIAKQICRGLSAVHKAGIIHGDLKPQNVMVMGNGVAKLMDFGVARTRANQDNAGVSVMGTPLYMSPEQAKGAALDERSDIYSAGVVMFEMFTGECPFRGRDVTEILHMHLNDAPADPRTLRPDLPPALSELILACLSKHRAQRPATAVDLDRWLMRVRV